MERKSTRKSRRKTGCQPEVKSIKKTVKKTIGTKRKSVPAVACPYALRSRGSPAFDLMTPKKWRSPLMAINDQIPDSESDSEETSGNVRKPSPEPLIFGRLSGCWPGYLYGSGGYSPKEGIHSTKQFPGDAEVSQIFSDNSIEKKPRVRIHEEKQVLVPSPAHQQEVTPGREPIILNTPSPKFQTKNHLSPKTLKRIRVEMVKEAHRPVREAIREEQASAIKTLRNEKEKKIMLLLKILGAVVLMIGLICGYLDLSSGTETPLSAAGHSETAHDDVVKDTLNIAVPLHPIDWKLSPVQGIPYLTESELKDEKKLLLVIIGHVFDVSLNTKSYGPGSGYNGFIGRDGSRAFVTGEFTETGLVSDVSGLTPEDYEGLANWLDFFLKTYPFKGYLVGRYFTNGQMATSYFQDFLDALQNAKISKDISRKVTEQFPPCNSAWSDKDGFTTLSCSKSSGGVRRSWEGYVYMFKESAVKSHRCACVPEEKLSDPRIMPYDGCEKKSSKCVLKDK